MATGSDQYLPSSAGDFVEAELAAINLKRAPLTWTYIVFKLYPNTKGM